MKDQKIRENNDRKFKKNKFKISWEGFILLAIIEKGIQTNSYNENQKN